MSGRRLLLVIGVVWIGLAIARIAHGDTLGGIFGGALGFYTLALVPPPADVDLHDDDLWQPARPRVLR